MTRIVFALVLGWIGLTWTGFASAATLVQHIVVTEDVVRIGDIWKDAGESANEVVGYSPATGEQAVLNHRWLTRVAEAYKVDWKPLGGSARAVVERSSFFIGREEITNEILGALIEQGASPDVIVDLGKRNFDVQVDSPENASVAVEDLTYDHSSGRFSASLRFPANGAILKQLRINGRTHKVVEVPVLTHRMAKDEIVTHGDIRWIKLRTDRMHPSTITEVTDLVGMAAQNSLGADEPIRHGQVARPLDVRKGALVTIILHNKRMTLTTRGKALESGSEGDAVKVLNTQSNKILQAEVIGPDRVRVLSADQLAMN
ncbi:hypothetical protein JCM17960_19710 [Magnetospira thiophila]